MPLLGAQNFTESLNSPIPKPSPRGGDSYCPKPYKFIGFGDSYGPKPYKFIGFGDSYGPNLLPKVFGPSPRDAGPPQLIPRSGDP